MKRWEKLVDEFISNGLASGLSEESLKTREKELLRFYFWSKKINSNLKIESLNLEHYQTYFKARFSFLSKQTIASVISMHRLMGDFLLDKNLWHQNFVRWIDAPKLNNTRKISKTYEKNELKKILEESFKAKGGAYQQALYPAMIGLLYSTGLRKTELINLDINCWSSENLTIKINSTKVRKERVVPVPTIYAKCLENYLAKRNNLLIQKSIQTEALFINQHGERILGGRLLVRLKSIAKKANVKRKVTVHMFRHSCATGLIEKGVPLPQVQRLLGHSTTGTTFRYLEVSNPERIKAMELHPINSILNLTESRKNESV